MLTNPLVITIDGVAHNLAFVNNDNFASTYLKTAVGYEYRLTTRHTYEGKVGPGQMERHNVDFTHTTWDAEGVPTIRQVYCVFRTPRGGDSVLTGKDVTGFNALVTANVTALLSWQ